MGRNNSTDDTDDQFPQPTFHVQQQKFVYKQHGLSSNWPRLTSRCDWSRRNKSYKNNIFQIYLFFNCNISLLKMLFGCCEILIIQNKEPCKCLSSTTSDLTSHHVHKMLFSFAIWKHWTYTVTWKMAWSLPQKWS